MSPDFAQHIPTEWHRAILDAPHVKRWLRGIEKAFEVHRVTIRDAVRFGDRIGFVFAEAEALHDGQPVPRYAVLRGDSVGILVVVNPGLPSARLLLTSEPRLPVAESAQISLPAGMIDDGAVESAALREFAEETGITLELRAEALIELGTYTLSPGGCDERITLYALELALNDAEMAALEHRRTGLAAENEQITLRLLPLDDVPALVTQDAKLRLAWHLYVARNGQ
ncbi:NUDIX hydrolase [Asaia krungthepensis]|uniref:GDP-mannose pyrophosphatase n=1 Tax=Asaia krungthepensis NRIC 0535 TaxID=1307925 RepID=A0ABQ0PYW0_9PROT|nr:NUDIX domain-containing protein [Asaia krungthepensis]GBQ85033.1 nucleoside diphosphate hydrolase [Asaia krungthepensis NRIC 0535]